MKNTPPQPVPLTVARFKDGVWQSFSDVVTEEVSLSVTWEDTSTSTATRGKTTLWAWPHNLAALALGHVLLDKAPSAHCLHRHATIETSTDRAYHITITKILANPLPEPPAEWQAQGLFLAMHQFIKADGLWDSTGCFHRAGVYDISSSKLLIRAEDIGRHNCIDRLAGWSVSSSVPFSDKALLVSARMTSSLCAKALRAGFRIIVSRSAVTTAAIAMVKEAGGTLIGFARTDEERFTVFSDPKNRIPTK